MKMILFILLEPISKTTCIQKKKVKLVMRLMPMVQMAWNWEIDPFVYKHRQIQGSSRYLWRARWVFSHTWAFSLELLS
jgi:hypothetical protein